MAAKILLGINGHKYNASGFSYDFYQIPDFKGKSVTGLEKSDVSKKSFIMEPVSVHGMFYNI